MTTAPVRLQLSAPSRGARGKPPRHFVDLTPDERVEAVTALGEKPFRAKQLATHYFTHLTADAADMTDLPKASRDVLVADLFPQLLTTSRTLTADHGTTVKTLYHLFDGAKVESVLMRYANRTTLCVSSQAGCGLACSFCATGKMGLLRNLSTAEIVEQVREAGRALAAGEVPGGATRLSNVVFMGMGEPLANYKAVMATVRRLVAPAPDDELRSELVPVNTRWNVDEALDSARRYFDVTGRRVSIEYALIRDVNDHAWRADLLGEKLRARGTGWVHCNPIPLNPTPGSRWTASDPQVEREFVARLRAHGIPTTIRDTRGSDIDGACGQLAAEEDE